MFLSLIHSPSITYSAPLRHALTGAQTASLYGIVQGSPSVLPLIFDFWRPQGRTPSWSERLRKLDSLKVRLLAERWISAALPFFRIVFCVSFRSPLERPRRLGGVVYDGIPCLKSLCCPEGADKDVDSVIVADPLDFRSVAVYFLDRSADVVLVARINAQSPRQQADRHSQSVCLSRKSFRSLFVSRAEEWAWPRWGPICKGRF